MRQARVPLQTALCAVGSALAVLEFVCCAAKEHRNTFETTPLMDLADGQTRRRRLGLRAL
jgi:hypothetical protein